MVLVSLSTARSKGKDASAQGSLTSIRSTAEIYNTGSGYGAAGTVTTVTAGTQSSSPNGVTNMCSDAPTGILLKAAAAQTGKDTVCAVGLSGASWVAYGALTTQTGTNYYCVDSNGSSGLITAAPSAFVSSEVKCK